MSNITTSIALRDSPLFRQACYIDGTWVEALGGSEIKVDDPAPCLLDDARTSPRLSS